MRKVPRERAGRFVAILFSMLGAFFATQVLSAALSSAWGNVAPPQLNVSPHGNLVDGQKISVEVGPNSYFTPHAGVHILECADPGGSSANLPTDITACDGNTIEGITILVGADGSFSDPSYPVYLLPSQALDEPSGNQPICDGSHYCVLYVGQNQNDFTAPKVFSTPFLISPGAAAPTTETSAGSTGSASSTSATSPSTTPSATTPGTVSTTDPVSTVSTSSSLADTGPPSEIAWVAIAATTLLVTGAAGRRLTLRRPR